MRNLRKLKWLSFFLAAGLVVSSCAKEEMTEQDNEAQAFQRARKISVEEAKSRLVKIISQLSIPLAYGDLFESIPTITGETALSSDWCSPTRSEKGDTLYYVFDFGNNEGFAIMSASTEYPELIALASSGNSNSIVNVGEDSGPVTIGGSDVVPPADVQEFYEYGDTEYETECMLPFNPQWSQKYPFNHNLDLIEGKSPMVGCVPLAVAMCMSAYTHLPYSYNGYVWNWNAIHTITTHYGALELDFNRPGFAELTTLLKTLGSKDVLDAQYGTERTTVDPGNISNAFGKFGYSNSGTLKSYLTTDMATVASEIKNGYPVIFMGYTAGGEGHSWVCNGMMTGKRQVRLREEGTGRIIYTFTQTVYFPYFNWGNGKEGNGYYTASLWDPNVDNAVNIGFLITSKASGTDGEYIKNRNIYYGMRYESK